jgi:outer membrane protein assembly factor BamA
VTPRTRIAIALALSAAALVLADGAARLCVDGVVVEGLPAEVELPDAILLSIPRYYDAGAVKRVAGFMSKTLADSGYPYSKIAASVIRDVPEPVAGGGSAADSGDVAVTLYFKIDHDERVCMGPPLIAAGRGRDGIYYRDVAFAPGAPYRAGGVEETVSRLLSRPYVRRAAAAPPVIIEDAPLCRDSMATAVAAISVMERRGLEAEGALGYESGQGGNAGKMSGRLDLSFINMLRQSESVGFSYVGTPVAQRLKSTVVYPWAFGLPVDFGGTIVAEIEDGGYGYLGGDVSATAEFGARMRCGVSLTASETVPPDSAGAPYAFYGADVFLGIKRRQWERGAAVHEFFVKTGSGWSFREKPYTRSRAEAAAGIHCPLFENYAAAGRVCAKSLFTEEGYLPPAELYRIGGQGSLRGYSEDEMAFRSAAYAQIEALFYFDRAASVYIFMDAGAGFNNTASQTQSLRDAEKLLGYGTGIRFPSRLGTVSLEWARNINDGKSLGRVHVGVKTGGDY